VRAGKLSHTSKVLQISIILYLTLGLPFCRQVLQVALSDAFVGTVHDVSAVAGRATLASTVADVQKNVVSIATRALRFSLTRLIVDVNGTLAVAA
jgi:hypothetical protein